jgi:hypothetical protein
MIVWTSIYPQAARNNTSVFQRYLYNCWIFWNLTANYPLFVYPCAKESHGGHEMTYDPNLQHRPMETDPTNPKSTVLKSGGGTGFLIAGILIAALVIGGYYYLNSGSTEMSAPTPPAPTSQAPAPAAPAPAEPPAAMAPAPTAPAPAEPAPAPSTTPAPKAPAPAQ